MPRNVFGIFKDSTYGEILVVIISSQKISKRNILAIEPLIIKRVHLMQCILWEQEKKIFKYKDRKKI